MIDLWAIDDANLDVYQFRMLCHIARVGVCWKSIRTLADDCNMSVGKASATRKSLEDGGHIVKTKDERTGRIGLAISSQYERSPDEQTQQKRSPDEQNVHDMNKTFMTRTKRSPHEHERSPHEPKTITIRQQHKETTKENIYIHPLEDKIQEIITALAQVTKTPYWTRTERDFEEAAHLLNEMSVTPDMIHNFAGWWAAGNGHYGGKPALKSLLQEFPNYIQSQNGHAPELDLSYLDSIPTFTEEA